MRRHTLSPKQTLAHLLIQRGRIRVPKITWDGGQIIVALIYEKLSIKHIWSDYRAVICTRLLNAPCMCFLSPSLPFVKQWPHSSSPPFINRDMRISLFVTQTDMKNCVIVLRIENRQQDMWTFIDFHQHFIISSQTESASKSSSWFLETQMPPLKQCFFSWVAYWSKTKPQISY